MSGFPHRPTLWPVQRLPASQSSYGLSLLSSPVVIQFPNFFGTVPVNDHSTSWDMPLAVCLLLRLYAPSDFNCPGLSWCGSWIWELTALRGETQSHNHRPRSPPKLPGQTWYPEQGPGILLSAYKFSLLSLFKRPLHTLSFKLHISWNSIGCSPSSSEDQLGVPVGCMSKWVQLPPTSPPSSILSVVSS